MKGKGWLIFALWLWVMSNTIYLWQTWLGSWSYLLVGLLWVSWFVVLMRGVYDFYFLVTRKNAGEGRQVRVVLMGAVLTMTGIWPGGWINWDRILNGKCRLSAVAEGAGRCYTKISLYDSHRFVARTVCFGISEITGTFTQQHDTLFFNNVSLPEGQQPFFDYAIVQSKKDHPDEWYLCMLMYESDSIHRYFRGGHNELIQDVKNYEPQ